MRRENRHEDIRRLSESNLRLPVNKISNEKHIIIIKKIYILKLLLNVVTDGIEALVSGNKFL
jgi:hypothetical protein